MSEAIALISPIDPQAWTGPPGYREIPGGPVAFRPFRAGPNFFFKFLGRLGGGVWADWAGASH